MLSFGYRVPTGQLLSSSTRRAQRRVRSSCSRLARYAKSNRRNGIKLSRVRAAPVSGHGESGITCEVIRDS